MTNNEVADYYRASNRKTGRDTSPGDPTLQEIIDSKVWTEHQSLPSIDFGNLIIFGWRNVPSINGHSLSEVSQEANRQLQGVWNDSDWEREKINTHLQILEQGLQASKQYPILLKEKYDEVSQKRSYNIIDGNHRMVATGVYHIRHGSIPALVYWIGQ